MWRNIIPVHAESMPLLLSNNTSLKISVKHYNFIVQSFVFIKAKLLTYNNLIKR